jgi:hypothetical protein
MASTVYPKTKFTGSAIYRITVEGIIPKSLLDCLASMELENDTSPGNTVSTITGCMQDQSQLNGVLNTLYNNRYTVISVIKIE